MVNTGAGGLGGTVGCGTGGGKSLNVVVSLGSDVPTGFTSWVNPDSVFVVSGTAKMMGVVAECMTTGEPPSSE